MSGLYQMMLKLVEGFEKSCDVLYISGLRSGESSLVHTIVDVVIHPGVELVDLGSEGIRYEAGRSFVGFAHLGREELVEAIKEHADDFAAFVVHNRF